jgi:hypothetical protein
MTVKAEEFKHLCNRHGFLKYEDKAHSTFNGILGRWVSTLMNNLGNSKNITRSGFEKAARKVFATSGGGTVSTQSGGDYWMPSEYYGTDSSRYSASQDNLVARPELLSTFPKQSGGNKKTQSGGDYWMPSEYYGTDSGRYTANQGSGTSSVDIARPEIPSTFGKQSGGSRKSVMRGGDYWMPSEYYGVDSGKYTSVSPDNAMRVTDVLARPSIPSTFPGTMGGGGFHSSRINDEVVQSLLKKTGSKFSTEAANIVSNMLSIATDHLFSNLRGKYKSRTLTDAMLLSYKA